MVDQLMNVLLECFYRLMISGVPVSLVPVELLWDFWARENGAMTWF